MATIVTIRADGGGVLSLSDVDVRLPQDTFTILGVPNFVGGPSDTQTTVPSLRQFGGATMTITANLPAPITLSIDPVETGRRIAQWKEDAKSSLVDSFLFVAIDFTLEVTFDRRDRPTLETLVRDWDFMRDIVVGLEPDVNGVPFSIGDGAGGGTNLDDTLNGDDGDNLFEALDGRDYVTGLGGADTLYGGAGNDGLYGGDGNDRLFGGDGDDEIYSQSGRVVIDGGSGDDYIDVREGEATLRGGAGADVLNIQTGSGVIFGGGGNDRMGGAFGSFKMAGGAGNDIVYGGFDSSTVKGGGGDDMVYAGARLDFRGRGDRVDGGRGDDSVQGSWGDDTLIGGAGADTFFFYQGDGTDDGYQFGTDVIADYNPREGDRLSLNFDQSARDATTSLTRTGAVLELDGYGTIEIVFDVRLTARTFYNSIDELG